MPVTITVGTSGGTDVGISDGVAVEHISRGDSTG